MVKLDKNNRLSTTLYRKPTDRPAYLHFSSDHPGHIKRSLPYSLALRCKRICSDPTDAEKQIQNLQKQFIKRNYPSSLVKNACHNALNTSSRAQTPVRTDDRVNFITTYHSSLSSIQKILSRHHNILLSDPRVSKIFPKPPRLVFKRNKNLRDFLVKARLGPPISQRQAQIGCRPCGKLFCKVCKHMIRTNTVLSKDKTYSFQIKGDYHCQTQNVVYLLECSTCSSQYIGQTSTPFNLRFNNHKSHCRSKPLLAVSKHCSQLGHEIDKFKTVILRSGFRSDAERIHFESFLIQQFKTLTIGINDEIGSLPPFL
jgi:hypothetical protein